MRGLAFSRAGHHFVSCSDDKTVKLWSASASAGATDAADAATPLATFLGRHAFTDIDHHKKEQFATGGPTLLFWDTARSEPVQSFEWGADSITRVRFNPAEHDLVGTLSNDRSVTLYDLRTGSALQKAVMQTRANAMAWNPMEPFHFTLASEDHSLYTFDMRKLNHAICVHSGHVSAVLAVDYAPTGKQFVSGSYDRTVRIWSAGQQVSDATYHTKRMQRLFCVGWSMDNAYLFSGSDDTNLRLWRAKANERATQPLPREGGASTRRRSLTSSSTCRRSSASRSTTTCRAHHEGCKVKEPSRRRRGGTRPTGGSTPRRARCPGQGEAQKVWQVLE